MSKKITYNIFVILPAFIPGQFCPLFFFCLRSFLDNFVHFSSFVFVHFWTILSIFLLLFSFSPGQFCPFFLLLFSFIPGQFCPFFFFSFRSVLDNFVHFSYLDFVHSCSFFFDKLIDLILFKSSNIFRNFGKKKKK